MAAREPMRRGNKPKMAMEMIQLTSGEPMRFLTESRHCNKQNMLLDWA